VHDAHFPAAAVALIHRALKLDDFGLGDGDTSLERLKDYLAQLDDRIFMLSQGHPTGVDYVVQVDGQKVTLSRPMEDLVFQEK
jgi:hypothetical protein